MRAVVQRVHSGNVAVDGKVIGSIEDGLLVYLGVSGEDTETDARYLAEKTANLRIFKDAGGKMNLSAMDLAKEILVISQFTLYADARKGRRPSYASAADPEQAEPLYRFYLSELAGLGFSPEKGRFGATMEVTYTNSGPITILLDSKKLF